MPNRSYPLPSHAGIEIESRRIAWEGRYAVEEISFRYHRFDGVLSNRQTWEVWRRGPAAAVLPYDPRTDCVVLIEQMRIAALAAAIDPLLTEVPAGMRDADEDPEQAARRECQEETGLSLGRMCFTGHYLLSPGSSDELLSLFVGEADIPQASPDGVLGTGGLASENEDIRVRAVPAQTAIDAAVAGQFSNVVTTVALLWLAAQRQSIRRNWLGGDG